MMVGWCAVAAVLALSTPAMAHVTTDVVVELPPTQLVETLAATAPSMDGLATLVAAFAVAMTLIARRRRAVAVACMALLLLIAFESGVHSVHHLTDQPDGQCVVASASAHTGGVAAAIVAFDRPVEATTTVAVPPAASATARPDAPDLGRAPPLA